MKFFITIEGPVGASLKKVLEMLINSGTYLHVNSVSEADLIVVEDKQALQELYLAGKRFAVVSLKEVQQLPKNVKWFHVTTAVVGLISYISEITKKLDEVSRGKNGEEEITMARIIETGTEYVPNDKGGALQILIVDDKQENLKLALDLLGEKHFITLAGGYSEGRRLIKENFYDVVLSDCQMPVDIKNSALSIEAVELGGLVHNGLFLIFPATKKGARFAIVTDANHHQDWVSAIFDDLRDPQTINGQSVLFINYMGKRWDEALGKLMSL